MFDQTQLEAAVRAFRPEAQDYRFAPIATGKFNTAFFVEADTESLVLRIAPPRDSVFLFYERRMMRQEPEIHALLRARTAVPVAEIVGFSEIPNALGHDYILMERLPGKPLCEAPCAYIDTILAQVGDALAQCHAQCAPDYGYRGAHAPMAPQPSWNEAFFVMWRTLLEDVAASGHYTQEEVDFLLRLLDKHAGCFDRHEPARLLHMDIWSQNILIDGYSKLTGLVDWDRALWGDPEIEFAVLDYCGISKPAFWEGYGLKRDTSAAAAVRHLFYTLYELQKYIVIRQGRGHDPAGARAYKEQVLHLARQLR